MEGPPLEEFDPTPAIQLWAMGATRRLNQRERKHYSARESKNRRKVLIDASSTEESSGTDSEEDFEREDKNEGGKVLICRAWFSSPRNCHEHPNMKRLTAT